MEDSDWLIHFLIFAGTSNNQRVQLRDAAVSPCFDASTVTDLSEDVSASSVQRFPSRALSTDSTNTQKLSQQNSNDDELGAVASSTVR